MQSLTEQVVEQGWQDKVLNDRQLARLLEGSDARRYGLVNRALHRGELLHLKRGLYVLAPRFQQAPPHPFVLAQALLPMSYISFESALAYHGWIPEAVYTTSSVTPERKSKTYDTADFGRFSFQPLALETGYFLVCVHRVEFAGQACFIASPLRALLDLICLHKQEWQGLAFLLEGMRIDEDELMQAGSDTLQTLRLVYKHRRMQRYIDGLARSLDQVQA